jgi:hypothetical protein
MSQDSAASDKLSFAEDHRSQDRHRPADGFETAAARRLSQTPQGRYRQFVGCVSSAHGSIRSDALGERRHNGVLRFLRREAPSGILAHP